MERAAATFLDADHASCVAFERLLNVSLSDYEAGFRRLAVWPQANLDLIVSGRGRSLKLNLVLQFPSLPSGFGTSASINHGPLSTYDTADIYVHPRQRCIRVGLLYAKPSFHQHLRILLNLPHLDGGQ